MKNILITGFQPFLQESLNPSQRLAESFSQQFDVVILPVSFENCHEVLKRKLDEKSYDFVLMLGQAGGRSLVCLEQVALNFLDSKYPDESGKYQQGQKISRDDRGAYISPLPLREWAELLQTKNLPVERSLTAGSYVCNFLYYKTMSLQGFIDKCLFVHVPYLPEQVVGKSPNTASLEFSIMRNCLEEIIKLIEAPSN